MVKEVIAYVTDDGKVHLDKHEAIIHNRVHTRTEGIRDILNRGNKTEQFYIFSDDLIEDIAVWLSANADELKELLNNV